MKISNNIVLILLSVSFPIFLVMGLESCNVKREISERARCIVRCEVEQKKNVDKDEYSLKDMKFVLKAVGPYLIVLKVRQMMIVIALGLRIE